MRSSALRPRNEALQFTTNCLTRKKFHGVCHDATRTRVDRPQPPAARPGADRFRGASLSGIAAIAYAKLRKTLGLNPRPIRVYDPIQQLAVIDEDVLDRFHVDTIEMGPVSRWRTNIGPIGPCRTTPLARCPNGPCPSGADGQWLLRGRERPGVGRMPDGAVYFEQCHWPYLENDDLDRIPEAMGETTWYRHRVPPGPLG